MYLQKNFVVVLFLFSSLLSISFLLSMVTVLANQRIHAGLISYARLSEEEIRSIQLIESMPEPSDNQSTQEQTPPVPDASHELKVIALTTLNSQIEEPSQSTGMPVNYKTTQRGENRLLDGTNENDLLPDEMDTAETTIESELTASDSKPAIPHSSDEGNLSESDEGQSSDEAVSSDEQDLNNIEGSLNEEAKKKEMPLQPASNSLACMEAWTNMGSQQRNESMCIELYRDNGDMLPEPEHDALVGFTLMMDEAPVNLDYYEFTNLPPGYYFANFYQLGEDITLLRQIERSVEAEEQPSGDLTSATDSINADMVPINE